MRVGINVAVGCNGSGVEVTVGVNEGGGVGVTVGVAVGVHVAANSRIAVGTGVRLATRNRSLSGGNGLIPRNGFMAMRM